MRTPAVVVNFKAYNEVDGPSSVVMAKICEEVSSETGISIVVCPPMVELSAVASAVSIPVFSQHADARVPGSATGWVTPSMVAACGAKGTLLNHSEHRMTASDIQDAICMSRKEGLTTIVCTDSVATSGAVAFYSPDFIAVEPPELIGGDVSVTEASPDIVRNAVDLVKGVDPAIKVLCGAGVKTGEDVKAALELGAEGVLLASGVVKSKDPRQAIMDLVRLI